MVPSRDDGEWLQGIAVWQQGGHECGLHGMRCGYYLVVMWLLPGGEALLHRGVVFVVYLVRILMLNSPQRPCLPLPAGVRCASEPRPSVWPRCWIRGPCWPTCWRPTPPSCSRQVSISPWQCCLAAYVPDTLHACVSMHMDACVRV